MRTIACSATALILLSSAVLAQGNPALGSQAQGTQVPTDTKSPDHTIPPTGAAQPQAPIADQSKPAAVGPAQGGGSSGGMASAPGQGPLGATPQTMPSTVSAANAKLDKLPTTALQFPLTDDQKALIKKSIASAPKREGNASLANIPVTGYVPTTTELQPLSAELSAQLPQANAYKYVDAGGRILIVDATNLTVVGEIAR